MEGNPAEVIQKQVAADRLGTMPNEPFGDSGPPATSVSALTGMTALTFPQGLGDDPAQPFFMTFQPKK